MLKELTYGGTFSYLILVLLVSIDPSDGAAQDRELTSLFGSNQNADNQAVTPYREPNHWLMSILKEFFTDIDWDTISKARSQIEKFVHKVDRLWRTFRSQGEPATGDSKRSYTSRWWIGMSGAKRAPDFGGADSTDIKAMLERVACFVGYLRILNHSNEALAEIDASKVISNLFSNTKNSTSYFSNLFG